MHDAGRDRSSPADATDGLTERHPIRSVQGRPRAASTGLAAWADPTLCRWYFPVPLIHQAGTGNTSRRALAVS